VRKGALELAISTSHPPNVVLGADKRPETHILDVAPLNVDLGAERRPGTCRLDLNTPNVNLGAQTRPAARSVETSNPLMQGVPAHPGLYSLSW
jgi:hypothetical protein